MLFDGRSEDLRYTCTLRKSTLADGSCGEMMTETAMRAPTQNATVVKKPNTFCARTRLECILAAMFDVVLLLLLLCWCSRTLGCPCLNTSRVYRVGTVQYKLALPRNEHTYSSERTGKNPLVSQLPGLTLIQPLFAFLTCTSLPKVS